MIIRFDLEALKPQVYRLAAMEQVKLLRVVLSLESLHRHPNTGSGVVRQPSHLMGPELHGIARRSLELDKVKLARLVANRNVRYAGRGPRLKPRRRQSPRRLRQPLLELPPKCAFALSRGCRNCLFLRE